MTAARIEALRVLADEFWIVMPPEGHAHAVSNTEDLEPYLLGEEPIDGPFAAVTAGIGSSGDLHYYIYPGYEDSEGAGRKASENVTDDIYAESPVAVVNLDTGERLRPHVSWVP